MASFWIRSSRTGSFFAFRIVGVIRLPSKRHDLKHNSAIRQLYALNHTTDTRKEWEEPGEMTIRRTSRPCIGGATPKKDRADRATDDPLVTPSRCRMKSPACSPNHPSFLQAISSVER